VQFLTQGRVLSGSVALLLAVAALLKAYELANRELPANSILQSSRLLMPLAVYEIALALWLISGLHAPVARIVTGLTFITFFEVSFYQALVGEGSCGCLGRVTVSPWIMAAVDLAAVLALLAWQPPTPQATMFTHRNRFLAALGVYSVVAAVLLYAMLDYAPQGALYSLRKDPALAKRLRFDQSRAISEKVVEALSQATGLNIRMSSGLAGDADDLGEIRTSGVRAWAVMEWLAQRQAVPVRWDRTEDGYQLVRAARLGRYFPFVFSGLILTLAAGYFLAFPPRTTS
jgi:hypothetical protein